MPKSLKPTNSPELALKLMTRMPIQEDPNRAIHRPLLIPRKGVLDS